LAGDVARYGNVEYAPMREAAHCQLRPCGSPVGHRLRPRLWATLRVRHESVLRRGMRECGAVGQSNPLLSTAEQPKRAGSRTRSQLRSRSRQSCNPVRDCSRGSRPPAGEVRAHGSALAPWADTVSRTSLQSPNL